MTCVTCRRSFLALNAPHFTPGAIEGKFLSLVYGAFTDDLNTLYVSTGGVAGLADVERARKVGRQNFFTYDAYARCDIVAGP